MMKLLQAKKVIQEPEISPEVFKTTAEVARASKGRHRRQISRESISTMADEADLNVLGNAPSENDGQQNLAKNDLDSLDAIVDARADEMHCKIELHIDFDADIEPIWLAPRTQRPK